MKKYMNYPPRELFSVVYRADENLRVNGGETAR